MFSSQLRQRRRTLTFYLFGEFTRKLWLVMVSILGTLCTKAAVAQRAVALGGLINGGCDRVSRLKNGTASALASGIRARSALWNARHSRHWRGYKAILTSKNRPELDMGGGTSAQQVDSTHVAFGVRRSAFGVQYLPLLLKSACNSLPYPCAPSNSKPRAS